MLCLTTQVHVSHAWVRTGRIHWSNSWYLEYSGGMVDLYKQNFLHIPSSLDDLNVHVTGDRLVFCGPFVMYNFLFRKVYFKVWNRPTMQNLSSSSKLFGSNAVTPAKPGSWGCLNHAYLLDLLFGFLAISRTPVNRWSTCRTPLSTENSLLILLLSTKVLQLVQMLCWRILHLHLVPAGFP